MLQTIRKPVLTTYDIARILCTTDTSVKRWIRNGQLEAYKTPGGHRRITRREFERFITENKIPVLNSEKITSRILIVDDDKDIRDLFAESLTNHNHRFNIEKASDGFHAGKLIVSFKPELVILDLMMPGIDGFAVCHDIKSSPDTKNILVIVITAYPTAENRNRALAAGADLFLSKPITPDLLCKVTDEILSESASGKKISRKTMYKI